jgi:hypothetical protein
MPGTAARRFETRCAALWLLGLGLNFTLPQPLQFNVLMMRMVNYDENGD